MLDFSGQTWQPWGMQKAFRSSLMMVFLIAGCDPPPQSDAGESRIGPSPTYVRYRPHGAAFDYFMPGDIVTIHGTYGDEWYCVRGKTKYRGVEYTGWVLASKVINKKPPIGDMPCKHPDKDGWSHTEYKICKLTKQTPVRYGPVGGAEKILDSDYPGGQIGPDQNFRLGWPTKDGKSSLDSNAWKDPVGDYLWVSVITNPTNFYNTKPKMSPGKSGWLLKSAVSCTPAMKPKSIPGDPLPPPDEPEPPGDPMSSDSGDIPEPVDPCLDCEQTYCPETHAACENSGDCILIGECVEGCPDACLSCWPGCLQAYPNGASSFSAHMDCMQQFCYQSCNQGDTCFDETIACKSNAECEAIYACIDETPNCDLSCWAQCSDAHPAGKDQFVQLTQCLNSGCP